MLNDSPLSTFRGEKRKQKQQSLEECLEKARKKSKMQAECPLSMLQLPSLIGLVCSDREEVEQEECPLSMLQLTSPIGLVNSDRQEDEHEECPTIMLQLPSPIGLVCSDRQEIEECPVSMLQLTSPIGLVNSDRQEVKQEESSLSMLQLTSQIRLVSDKQKDEQTECPLSMLQLLSPIGLVSSGRQEDEREECPLSKSQEGLVRQADENGVKIRETEKAIEKLPQLQEQARPVDSKLREDQGSPASCRKEAVAAAGIILEELLDEIHAFSELQEKLCGTVLPNYNINLSEKVPPDRSEELEKDYENIQTLKLEISRLQSPHFKKPQNTQEICDRSNIETVPP